QALLLAVHVGADGAAHDAADGRTGEDLVGLPLALEVGAGGAGRGAHDSALPRPVALGVGLGAGRGACQQRGHQEDGNEQVMSSQAVHLVSYSTVPRGAFPPRTGLRRPLSTRGMPRTPIDDSTWIQVP